MKKIISIVMIVLISIYSLCYVYNVNRTSDLKYAIKRYTTTGFLNKYKLCTLDNWELDFSDGNMCIVNVSGLSSKSPHDIINYKMFLEKNKKGLWKVKKYYLEKRP